MLNSSQFHAFGIGSGSRKLARLVVALAFLAALSGCPLSDHYYVEGARTVGGTTTASNSGGARSALAGAGSDYGDVTNGGADSSANGAAGSVSDGVGSTNGGASNGGTVNGGPANGGAANGGAGGSCVFGPFGAPELISGLAVGGALFSPSPSADGLSLYFSATGTGTTERIYRATRANRAVQFSAATTAAINSTASDGSPCLSFDELTLYFYSTRSGGSGNRDLYYATRLNSTVALGNPTPLAGLNTSENDHHPWISRDELTLLYESLGESGMATSDIWMATRADKDAPFAAAERLAGINSPSREMRAALSSDALTIYFASDRAGGLGDIDIWYATRTSSQSKFSNARILESVNGTLADTDPTLSRDDTELYFSSARSGSYQLWRAVRSCD